jgi:hypothetical protein
MLIWTLLQMAFIDNALKSTDIFEENVQFQSIYDPSLKLRSSYRECMIITHESAVGWLWPPEDAFELCGVCPAYLQACRSAAAAPPSFCKLAVQLLQLLLLPVRLPFSCRSSSFSLASLPFSSSSCVAVQPSEATSSSGDQKE